MGEFVAAHELGPDALDLDVDSFRKLAEGRRGAVKSWLMNQKSIAGVGNVYADEMLFQARIRPQQSPAALTDDELERRFACLGKILDGAIEAGADPARMPNSWLLPNRGKGGGCPACGKPLKSASIGGRTAWYCPRDQQ